MDWTPATGQREEPATLLRPARFAPEKPTGLEGLIEKFGISSDEPEAPAEGSTDNANGGSEIEKGMLVGVIAGLGLVATITLAANWWPLAANTQVLTPHNIVADL